MSGFGPGGPRSSTGSAPGRCDATCSAYHPIPLPSPTHPLAPFARRSLCQAKPLPAGDAALEDFGAALRSVCAELAADVARNGEGTTHVMRIAVKGAPSFDLARGVGKAVVNSPLVKTAIAGNDPNIGRIVGAVGSYLGKTAPELDLSKCAMSIGGEKVFAAGSFRLSPQTEASLSAHIKAAEQEAVKYPVHDGYVEVEIDLGVGREACTVLGSDLTHDYVDINADYRS